MTARYYHSTGHARAYGPSNEGETLAQYKARVRRAYGDLRGVTFGTRAEFHPAFFTL